MAITSEEKALEHIIDRMLKDTKSTDIRGCQSMVEALKELYQQMYKQNLEEQKKTDDIRTKLREALDAFTTDVKTAIDENKPTATLDMGPLGKFVVDISNLTRNAPPDQTGEVLKMVDAILNLLRGYSDHSALVRLGMPESKARHVAAELKSTHELITMAEQNKTELTELKIKHEALERSTDEKKELAAAVKEIDGLKDRLDRALKVNPECERYIEHIRVLNSRIASLQQNEQKMVRMKEDYDNLLARYEMLRVQYVRIRTAQAASCTPDWVAGLKHPTRPGQRVVTNLYGTHVTDVERRRAAGEDVYTSDSDTDAHIDVETRGRMLSRKRRLARDLRLDDAGDDAAQIAAAK